MGRGARAWDVTTRARGDGHSGLASTGVPCV